jgi:hypothetical protein
MKFDTLINKQLEKSTLCKNRKGFSGNDKAVPV